jgi:hypothetical protein
LSEAWRLPALHSLHLVFALLKTACSTKRQQQQRNKAIESPAGA